MPCRNLTFHTRWACVCGGGGGGGVGCGKENGMYHFCPQDGLFIVHVFVCLTNVFLCLLQGITRTRFHHSISAAHRIPPSHPLVQREINVVRRRCMWLRLRYAYSTLRFSIILVLSTNCTFSHTSEPLAT